MTVLLWLTVVAAIVAAAGLILAFPGHLRWGATKFDTRRPMPGDELVPAPFLSATRALTIGAPADRIWPLLLEQVQAIAAANRRPGKEPAAGSGDGPEPPPVGRGLIQAGDVLSLDPVRLRRPVKVLYVEPSRHLVLANPPVALWSMGLYPVASRSTRLVVRTRTHRVHWISRVVDALVAEPGAFMVARQILLGTRNCAEAPSLLMPSAPQEVSEAEDRLPV